MARESEPAPQPLQAQDYWQTVRRRFGNPHFDHRPAQIAQEGPEKLALQVFPLMTANLGCGSPIDGLARIVRAWLAHTGAALETAFSTPTLLPAAIRNNMAIRAAMSLVPL